MFGRNSEKRRIIEIKQRQIEDANFVNIGRKKVHVEFY